MANENNKISIDGVLTSYTAPYLSKDGAFVSVNAAYISKDGVFEQWWSGEPPAPWLGTWAKRRKITIDNTDIDSTLTHFALSIFLNTSAGTGSTDVSDIFDEVGANSKKIAVCDTTGSGQLYVEIEHWDDTTESGVLWVSRSDWTIASASDTNIYIYYDNTEDDNDTYVGETGDAVVYNVWDDDYVGVWHLDDGVSAGATTPDAHIDSTSNTNHGDQTGNTEGTGQIANGQIFDGNDYIDLGGVLTDVGFGKFTISAWIEQYTTSSDGTIVSSIFDLENHVEMRWDDSHNQVQWKYKGSNTAELAISVVDWEGDGTKHLVTMTLDTTADAWKAYLDGGLIDTSDTLGAWAGDIDTNFSIGAQSDIHDIKMEGMIDEVRISSVARTTAWIKAGYVSQKDEVIKFSSTETL